MFYKYNRAYRNYRTDLNFYMGNKTVALLYELYRISKFVWFETICILNKRNRFKSNN